MLISEPQLRCAGHPWGKNMAVLWRKCRSSTSLAQDGESLDGVAIFMWVWVTGGLELITGKRERSI